MYKKIKLSQGKYALVDSEDFEFLNQWKWTYRQGYAVRGEYIGRISDERHPSGRQKYKSRLIAMHRVIAKTPPQLTTDHINGNKLDNRKENLRNCTKRQNCYNTGTRNPNKDLAKSPYVGVHISQSGKRWISHIAPNRKSIHLGTFDTAEEAAEAYNMAALSFYGQFAKLNEVRV